MYTGFLSLVNDNRRFGENNMRDINENMPVDAEEIEDLEDLDGIVVMEDEDGNVVEFEFLDLIEYEGNDYAILLPPDDDEVVILRVDSVDEDTEEYIGVDDEDILQAVFGIFREKYKDDFTFAD